MGKQFLWTEIYRPRTIQDCILPDSMKEVFQGFVHNGELINMLFHGTSGVGKTTVAKALCDELQCDYMFINGSEENGIDTLRTKIRSFASSSSLSDKKKVIILDDAGNMSPAMQEGLKAFIEEFSSNCRFIFTCNNKNKIVPPLQSRTTVIEFKLDKDDRKKMGNQFIKRLFHILDNEKVKYDKKVVAQVLAKYFPDYRRILNELQRYSANGEINEGILANISNTNMDEVVNALREKDFRKMRAWVVNNDLDASSFFTDLYTILEPQINELPELIIILNDYSWKSAFCADQGINFSSCLVEIMATCSFKGE